MVQIKFYITTSIIYTNAKPHVGFALELAQADAIARFHRLKGDDVFFLTGSDEHGIKNERSAKEAGLSTQSFVDKNTEATIALAKRLNISNDFYIRTSDKKMHYPTTQDIWKKLVKAKDIYKKKYSGLYCSGCETFVKETDLVDGKCPIHDREPETIEEENYFFKLSKYSDKIIKLIESDKYLITPSSKKNEILNFIKGGLDDISFSRSKENLSWGIPVPGDPKQTIYVWCDALTNYLSGVGYSSDKKKFKKYWPADIHLVGKDITKFHAIYWPAMLLSAKIPLPKSLLVHGFVTSQGKKMSKSLGNVIDPIVQLDKYGTDSVRYYLLKEIPSDDDGDYTDDLFIQRHNSELANDLGNLVFRVLTLTEKNFSGKVPKKYAGELSKKFKGLPEKIENNINDFKLHIALNDIWRFVGDVNRYISEKEPWKVTDKKELEKIIYESLESLRVISIMLSPFLPETSKKIQDQLGVKKSTWKDLKWGLLKPGTKTKKGEILFKKIDTNVKTVLPKVENKAVKKQGGDNLITIEDFGKIELKVATILEAEAVEGSDKLVKLQIDVGEKKQIVAGIRKAYSPEELVGKQIIVVNNLQPVKLKGVDSNGMLLAASDGSGPVLLTVEKPIKNGTKVS